MHDRKFKKNEESKTLIRTNFEVSLMDGSEYTV